MLAAHATNCINSWMTEVVAIAPGGTITQGDYDGYGRVVGETREEDVYQSYGDQVDWHHKRCWENAGKPGYKGPAKNAPDQGYFFDDGAHDFFKPRDKSQMKKELAKQLARIKREAAAEKKACAAHMKKVKAKELKDKKAEAKLLKDVKKAAKVPEEPPEDPEFLEFWNTAKTPFVPLMFSVGSKPLKRLAREAFKAGKAALASKF
jgi:hypothetical protein